MDHVISIRPDPDGWAVEMAATGYFEMFQNAAAAEQAARALGDQLAAEGKAAEIRIHLRDGRLGAKFLCPQRVLEWV